MGVFDNLLQNGGSDNQQSNFRRNSSNGNVFSSLLDKQKQQPVQKPAPIAKPTPKPQPQQNFLQKAKSTVGNLVTGAKKVVSNLFEQKPQTSEEKATALNLNTYINRLQTSLKTNTFSNQIGIYDMKGSSTTEKKAFTKQLLDNAMQEQYRLEHNSPANKAGYFLEDAMNAVVPGVGSEAASAEKGTISIGKSVLKLVRNAGLGAGTTAGVQALEGQKVNPRDLLLGAVTGVGLGGFIEKKGTMTKSLYDVVTSPMKPQMSKETARIVDDFHKTIDPHNMKPDEFNSAFDAVVQRKEKIDAAMQTEKGKAQATSLQEQSTYLENQIHATYNYAQVKYPELFSPKNNAGGDFLVKDPKSGEYVSAFKDKKPPEKTPAEATSPFTSEAKKYTSASDFASELGTTEKAGVGTIPSEQVVARDSIDEKAVGQYMDQIQAGKQLEPIVVEMVDGKPTTTDGSNRLTAAQRLSADIQVVNPKGDVAGLKTVSEVYNEATKTTNANPRPLEPVGTGETKTSKLAQGVEANAIKNKLSSGYSDLPQYQQVNLDEQAQQAADIISKDPAYAIDIALGKENPPKGVLPESVFVAVEEQAIKNQDIGLIQRLATESSLSTEATAMGQRIRALGERNPDSPITIIRQIAEDRKAAAEKKLKGRSLDKAISGESKKIESAIKQKAPDKYDWNTFINSIECA